MTCSFLKNDSTEERNNSAFLPKILAGKLPIIRRETSSIDYVALNQRLAPNQTRTESLGDFLKKCLVTARAFERHGTVTTHRARMYCWPLDPIGTTCRDY